MRTDMISVAVPAELYLLLHDLKDHPREPVYEVIIRLLELNSDKPIDTYGQEKGGCESTHPTTSSKGESP